MIRRCPTCADVPLVERDLHGQQVDQCPSCRGLYFDAGELEATVELVRLFDEARLDEPEIDTARDREPDQPRPCPVDGEVFEKVEVGGEVVDRCPRCEGIWLDDGEVAALKLAEQHIHAYLGLYIRLGE